ncbi:MAG TPA: hypothetical protein VGS07_09955 [Thermoanaerobaculia bacterium]|jgi:hypothetical protein|nr:hypothetical protein [Thermoanaerobaculia bacterium]
MKRNRFSSASIRKAWISLAGLFLAASLSAGGVSIHVGPITFGVKVDPPSKKWADALVPQIKEVEARFEENRRALQTVQGPGGKPAYLRKDVVDLMARTGKDLDQAIKKVGPDLLPLEDWSTEELAGIQAKLAATPTGSKTAALFSGPSTPFAVAVVASLSSPPKPTSPKAAAPPPDTVPADQSSSLLDEVGKVVSLIFTLAANDDLEVKLWVGSTAPRTAFSFWPQGQITGDSPAPHTVRTDGKLDHVIRGLYLYRAAWTQGAVTQSIQYPNPAGTPAAQTPSERLDLVKGSRFFCCRFDQSYCHHVDNEKDCRP